MADCSFCCNVFQGIFELERYGVKLAFEYSYLLLVYLFKNSLYYIIIIHCITFVQQKGQFLFYMDRRY